MSYVSSIFVLAAFIALACLPWLSRQLRFLQTRSWPTVQGSVDSAWVSTELQGKSTFYKGKLAYSYTVESQRHTGEIQPIQRTASGSESSGKNVPENRNSGTTMNRCTNANWPESLVMVEA